MALPRRAREAMLVIALLLVTVLVLRANQKNPSELNVLDRAVLQLSAPLESAFTAIGRSIAGTWRGYVYLVDVKQENQRLSDENRRLAGELSQARLAEGRVTQLEAMLALRAELPSETLSARVVGIESSPYYRVVRIKLDRGAGEVKPGMVVVVPEGVVGRISRVYGGYSDVILAVDPDSAIDVQVPRTGARGVLRGIAGDNRYRTHVPELPRGEDAREGDEVVTSGIGGFPRELPLGRITKVVRPDSGLWQELVVAPSVDFDKLTEVLVVLAAPPPPDPDGGKRAPEPHWGVLAPR